jgi:hypothetical protein
VNFNLRTKIGPRTERSSSRIPSGAHSAKKACCSFENTLRSGRRSTRVSRTSACAVDLIDAEQIPAGNRVHLGATALGPSQLLRKLIRYDGTQLPDRVVSLALHPAGSHHDACLREAQIGRSKKKNWRIWASRVDAEHANRHLMADAGTVSLRSTLSASAISPSSSASCSSESVLPSVRAIASCDPNSTTHRRNHPERVNRLDDGPWADASLIEGC